MLGEEGYRVFPIRAPTVREGEELIRVILHAGNGGGEIEGFVDALGRVEGRLGGSKVASVPFMITREMRRELGDLGYGGGEIKQMVPKEAHRILSERINVAEFVK
jgi:hypothetical protein